MCWRYLVVFEWRCVGPYCAPVWHPISSWLEIHISRARAWSASTICHLNHTKYHIKNNFPTRFSNLVRYLRRFDWPCVELCQAPVRHTIRPWSWLLVARTRAWSASTTCHLNRTKYPFKHVFSCTFFNVLKILGGVQMTLCWTLLCPRLASNKAMTRATRGASQSSFRIHNLPLEPHQVP